MNEVRTRVGRVIRPVTATVLGAALVVTLTVASLLSAAPAGAKAASTPSTARFVNMAVTPDDPDGTAVDIYGATTFTHSVSVGDKVTAAKPAPKKVASKLAFGASTKYLTVPVGTVLLVTAAGKPEILAYGAVEGYNTKPEADTYFISRNGSRVLSDSDSDTTTTTEPKGQAPLSIGAYSEARDYTYTDGHGRPIKDAAVLFTHTDGITEGAQDDAWQMGVVGKGCLPEYVGDPDSHTNFNSEYLSPGSGDNGTGIEYVASEPGSLELGLWSGDSTDCSGTPVTSGTANVTAGSRSYVYWYGPASSPKLLVLSVPQPKGEKFATTGSTPAYTGSGDTSSDTSGDTSGDTSNDSGDSSSTTTSSTSTTSP